MAAVMTAHVSLCAGGSKGKAEIQLNVPEKRDANELYPGKMVHMEGMQTFDPSTTLTLTYIDLRTFDCGIKFVKIHSYNN